MVKRMDASRTWTHRDDDIDVARAHLRTGGHAAAGASLARHTDNACDEDAPARDRKVDRLVSTLERDVIPRLVQAHRAILAPAAIDRAPGQAVAPDDISTVTALALRGDPAEIMAYVEALQARGVALEHIYLDLLGPVAQRLGTMWEEDACDFGTVTIGLSALQHVVLQSSRQFWRMSRRDHPMRRVALAPTPGEQHTFGLLIVAEFFRRSGWDVWSGTGLGNGAIAAQVHAERYAVAGFTLAGEDHVSRLAGIIRQVRQVSMNRGIGILVGGPLFIAHPELVLEVGADATAADGPQAVLLAETLLALDGAQA